MWEKIKKILSKGEGKCIIVEDNQPAYVVLKWEDYEEIIDICSTETENVNRNIDHWKAEENAKTEPEVNQLDDNTEVKIEDLPF